MSFLFATLDAALLDLAFLAALLLVVLFGFAMAFYLAFGLHVAAYATVADSLLSMLQLVLGIVDYEELYRANRLLAPLLFVGFTLLVVFVVANLFLAIVTDAYMRANERRALSEHRNVPALLRGLLYKRVLTPLTGKQMVDDEGLSDVIGSRLGGTAADQLRGVDMDGDNQLDPGELEVGHVVRVRVCVLARGASLDHTHCTYHPHRAIHDT